MRIMSNLIINLIWWVLCIIVFVLGYYLGTKSMYKIKKRRFYNFTNNELEVLYTILINVVYINPNIDNLFLDICHEWNDRNINSKHPNADIYLGYVLRQLPIVESYYDEGNIKEYRELVYQFNLVYAEIISLKSSNSNIDIDSFSDKYKLAFKNINKNYVIESFNNKSIEFFVECLNCNKALLKYIDNLIEANNRKEGM